MGALIPNVNDAEVIDRLNTVFGKKLKKLRKHMQDTGDDTFAPGRRLHRISHRLKIFPTSGDRPKGRWYVFLRDLIGDTNRTQILQAIKDAVNDPGCVGIRFWARYDPSVTTGYKTEIIKEPPDPADPTPQFWVNITLLCNHAIDPQLPGDPSKPPADANEKGPEQPDVDTP